MTVGVLLGLVIGYPITRGLIFATVGMDVPGTGFELMYAGIAAVAGVWLLGRIWRRTRVRSRPARSGVFDRAEAAVALLEVADRLVERLAAEVGPEHRREPQLGVGRPPTAGSSRCAAPRSCGSAGRGRACRGGTGARRSRARRSSRSGACRPRDVARELLHGVDDLGAAAVVERDRERHAGVVAGQLLGGLRSPSARDRGTRQSRRPAEPDPNVHLVAARRAGAAAATRLKFIR